MCNRAGTWDNLSDPYQWVVSDCLEEDQAKTLLHYVLNLKEPVLDVATRVQVLLEWHDLPFSRHHLSYLQVRLKRYLKQAHE